MIEVFSGFRRTRSLLCHGCELVEVREGRRPQALTVAERKRQQRARLRQAGLVATEVWIPKQHRTLLRRFERLLRDGVIPELPNVVAATNSKEMTMDVKLLRQSLDNLTSENGFRFTAREAEDASAIEIVVEDRDEFPIMVAFDDEQLLCLTYLWDEAQVKAESRTDLLATLLEMNVPLPLSSFGKIGDRYVLFGALAASASIDDIVTELESLSDNTLEAIEAVAPFID